MNDFTTQLVTVPRTYSALERVELRESFCRVGISVRPYYTDYFGASINRFYIDYDRPGCFTLWLAASAGSFSGLVFETVLE